MIKPVIGAVLVPLKLENSADIEEVKGKPKAKWMFGKRFRKKSTDTSVITELPPLKKVLVDQGQQYDENDVVEYFENSSNTSTFVNGTRPETFPEHSTIIRERSKSCDIIRNSAQNPDPCYIADSDIVSNATSQVSTEPFRRRYNSQNSLIIRDSKRNRVQIQIIYDENMEDEENVEDYKEYDKRNSYVSNERGETIVELESGEEVRERAIDVPNDYLRKYQKDGVVFRRPLKPQIRTLRPPSNGSEEEEWITFNNDEKRNSIIINLRPVMQAPVQLPPATKSEYSSLVLEEKDTLVPDRFNTIHRNSILYRSNQDMESKIRQNAHKQFSINQSEQIYSNDNNNIVAVPSPPTNTFVPDRYEQKESPSFKNQLHMYHRFGGSIQSLPKPMNMSTKKISASVDDFLSKTERDRRARNLNSAQISPIAWFKRWSRNNCSSRTPSATSQRSRRSARRAPFQWRNLFPFLRTKQTTLQDLDDGFFEKFGSLLRQKSQVHDESVKLAPLPEDMELTTTVAAEDSTSGSPRIAMRMMRMNAIEEGEDSGTETLQESEDSETEEQQQNKETSFIDSVVGWNVEELYEEILYEILHNVGCEHDQDYNENALFEYIQDAFKIGNERHEELLAAAKQKEAPEIRLNIECVEAKALRPKDPNGLSDPFVTMYLASTSTHRYNTSVKKETLDPKWEEHFSLPISKDPNEENLIIEVWDFDPAETVKDKMGKFMEVKGVKGLRRLMKEIVVTASSGKHENELIGKATVPLKSVPAAGLVMWYNLDKKGKTKTQGMLKIRLNFSSEKNKNVAAQEHRHLLRILLLQELETSRVAHYWWSGKFGSLADEILTQHIAQSGLSASQISLAEYGVFSGIHTRHPLSYGLFEALVEKVMKSLLSNAVYDAEDIKIFWEATRNLLPSCMKFIRNLQHQVPAGNKDAMNKLGQIVNIISKVAMLEPPPETDLFPSNIYPWITRQNDSKSNWDIQNALRDTVTKGAVDRIEHIDSHANSNIRDITKRANHDNVLQHLIENIQFVRADVQRSIEYFDKIFQESLNFQYTRVLFLAYEAKLAEIIQPTVEEICKTIKRIDYTVGDTLNEGYENISMGTTMFELYLVLQKFITLGNAIIPGEDNFKLNDYYNWFSPAVQNWLEISAFKACTRIQRAVELDKLTPVDDSVKYSSSAVDTLAIFYQIKIFWQQLAWPDAEGSYIFVSKIVDDICNCCNFYAKAMAKRVDGMGDVETVYEKRYEITPEWCLAINNIDYIRQSLSPFLNEFGIADIIARLADLRTVADADRCAETVKNVIANAVDTQENEIHQLIQYVAKKMEPPMKKFLAEGAEFVSQDSNSMDRLMIYMENSLKVLHSELNGHNFDKMLDSIWTELSSILYDLVQSNLDKRRPPSFYSNLRDTLEIMKNSFNFTQVNDDNSEDDQSTLVQIQKLLELHGYETHDLIHQYYLERHNEQLQQNDTPMGQLTIQCVFRDNNLEVTVLSARNITPMDTDGSCDPFVRIHFLPEDKFLGVATPKTNVQNKTLFPIFDQKFVIQLTPEQRTKSDALILFSIKDKDLFGMSNQYISECFILFKEIDETSADKQVHLTLTKPTSLEYKSVRCLELRQGDKLAKDFLKKLRQKMAA